MRIPRLVYPGLFVVLVVICGVLWNELRAERLALQAERQASEELRAQLVQARAERVVAAAPSLPSTASPVAPADSRREAELRVSAELTELATAAAKRQQAVLQDNGYREGRVAELRAEIRKRNPLLARELGIPEQQAEKVLDLLAEAQFREEALSLELASNGSFDAAAVARMNQQREAERLQQSNALAALLGPAKAEQVQDIRDTNIARTRLVNLRNLLVQSGQPLSAEQDLALTRVVADQQKREERETQQLRASGQLDSAAQFDRAEAGDRRILDDAAAFLTPRQVETIRTRFQQRAAMERASGSVQSRERQGIQATPK